MTTSTMYIVWAVAIVAFCILEGTTAQLVSVWFVIGSVAGLVSNIFGAPFWLQIVLFITVSVVALLATRPLVKKKLNINIQKTNADRCIGMSGVVIEDIDNLAPSGQVKTDGKVWSARSLSGEPIPKDTVVTVEKIDGVKLIVK